MNQISINGGAIRINSLTGCELYLRGLKSPLEYRAREFMRGESWINKKQ